MKKDIKIFDLQEQFKSIADEVNNNIASIINKPSLPSQDGRTSNGL